MGYQLIDPGELEPLPNRPSTAIEISDHYVPPPDFDAPDVEPDERTGRGPQNVGFRIYHVQPGEDVGQRYHYHDEQEEIFYTISGSLHVETPDREYVVPPNHVFLVEPGSPKRAFNPASNDEAVHLLAIGAPSYGVMGRNDGHAYDPDEDG